MTFVYTHTQMQNRFITTSLIALCLAAVPSLESCKKEDIEPDTTQNTTNNSPTPTVVFSFKEGTTVITADSAKAILYTSGMLGAQGSRKLDVYAFKNGQQIIEFHFSPKTGTQPVAQNGTSAWLSYITNNGNTYPDDFYHCSTGNFSLSVCDTINNKITGTFDFVGSNGTTNKTITEGSIAITVIKKQN